MLLSFNRSLYQTFKLQPFHLNKKQWFIFISMCAPFDSVCFQVETFEGELKKQEVEMELLHQRLKGAKEELKDASLEAQGQKETAAIFKQKYTAAMEKVHKVQGQVELLEEELQYSQQQVEYNILPLLQVACLEISSALYLFYIHILSNCLIQLSESKLATHSVKDELAEMVRQYQEKVGQWEQSQEALDQLADELQANQSLLSESQREVDHLKGLAGSLQEQVDTLKQQVGTSMCTVAYVDPTITQAHIQTQTHTQHSGGPLSLCDFGILL